MPWAGRFNATNLSLVPPPPPLCPAMPTSTQQARRLWGAGKRAGCVPFCRCRVIYDMRAGHCLDPSCIFPRALPLFPAPRCAPATVPLLWDVLPAPRLCGAVPGRAAHRRRTHLEPRAPLPATQPLGGPADVPRAWEWGFRPLQVHGHRRHSAAEGGGNGIWGVWLHSPFPFSAGSVLGAYRSPRPFLLLTSAHINKLPHRASVEQSVP